MNYDFFSFKCLTVGTYLGNFYLIEFLRNCVQTSVDFFAQKILQYIGIEGKTKLTKCMSNDYYASQYLLKCTQVY